MGIAQLYADCHFFGSWIGSVVHANTVTFAGKEKGIFFVITVILDTSNPSGDSLATLALPAASFSVLRSGALL